MTSKNIIETKPARNPQVLRKRIERFLVAPKYGPEVSDVIGHLSELGRVAVFGGTIRDLALFGATASPRDIDLVVECDGVRDLSDSLMRFRPQRNRFGGFRFRTERWSFDVWRVQDTWAVREGLVKGCVVEDLVRTTFFDWDAVLYTQKFGELTALPNYFDRLSSLIVDINLQENPNPLGSLIRTLRIMALGRARLGKRLMLYAWEQLSRFGDDAIVAAELQAFQRNCLSLDRLESIRKRLAAALDHGEATLEGLVPTQLDFDAFAETHSTRYLEV
jgi:hypothetical protein